MNTCLISFDAFAMIGLLCAMESLYSQDESIKKFNYDKSYKNLWNELSFESNNKDIKVNFHEKCMTLSGFGVNCKKLFDYLISKFKNIISAPKHCQSGAKYFAGKCRRALSPQVYKR